MTFQGGEKLKADAVFEGGGARGIAFIGAIQAMEEENVKWERLAGTSAGALIAALLASGYKSHEIMERVSKIEFSKFRGKTILNRIPVFGALLELMINLGIYKNDYLESWVDSLLSEKGIETFADLPEGKLKIIASDISNGQMLILPDDLGRYRMSPADLKVSTAVMMSASIPFSIGQLYGNQNNVINPIFWMAGYLVTSQYGYLTRRNPSSQRLDFIL